MLFLNYCIFSGSAEALVRCGGKLLHLLIAYFPGNTCAKHYEELQLKMSGMFFLRHSVVTDTPSRTDSELSQLIVQILDTLRLWDPLWGGEDLGTTYDVQLGLIGKRVVDFPLVLI